MMKIAVPVSSGMMSPHFGRCDEFCILELNPSEKKILSKSMLKAPEHERGVFPTLLHNQGVTHVIVSGMGPRAVAMLEDNGIVVIMGAMPGEPEAVALAFLNGELQTTESPCDHGEDGHGCGK